MRCSLTILTPPQLTYCTQTPGISQISVKFYDNETLSTLHLLSMILCWSSIPDTAAANGYKAFDAFQKLVGWTSAPLSDHQWKVEAHRLFQTSLAKMHVALGAIAAGEGQGIGAYNAMANYSTDYCSLMRVHMEGYKNISVIGLAGMIFLVSSLWVLTFETNDSIVLIWLFEHAICPLGRRIWGYVCWVCRNASNRVPIQRQTAVN